MISKKLWVVSEIYYPVKTSTGYYITEIAEYLSEKGLDVHVICTGAAYNEGKLEARLLKEECRNGVHIHRVFIGNIDKNSFVKRFFRLLLSSIRLFFKILSSVNRGDELLVVTNPAFLLLMMPFVKHWKKVEYTILVHDVFPENLVAINKLSSSSQFYRWLKFVFDKAYTKARQCISIGRDMTDVLERKTGNKTKVSFIPIWAENELVFPLDKHQTKLNDSLGLNEKFVFQFAGNLGHAQGLDNVLKAIELVDNPNIHFVFIGSGAKYAQIERFSKEHANVSLIGFLDRSQQNDFLNACDVAIITLSDGMYGLGVPSKSYNIMSAGKPILMIGDKRSEIALCIAEYKLGWVVEPNNPVALKNRINRIYNDRKQLTPVCLNARMAAETIFAKRMVLEQYYTLFN